MPVSNSTQRSDSERNAALQHDRQQVIETKEFVKDLLKKQTENFLTRITLEDEIKRTLKKPRGNSNGTNYRADGLGISLLLYGDDGRKVSDDQEETKKNFDADLMKRLEFIHQEEQRLASQSMETLNEMKLIADREILNLEQLKGGDDVSSINQLIQTLKNLSTKYEKWSSSIDDNLKNTEKKNAIVQKTLIAQKKENELCKEELVKYSNAYKDQKKQYQNLYRNYQKLLNPDQYLDSPSSLNSPPSPISLSIGKSRDLQLSERLKKKALSQSDLSPSSAESNAADVKLLYKGYRKHSETALVIAEEEDSVDKEQWQREKDYLVEQLSSKQRELIEAKQKLQKKPVKHKLATELIRIGGVQRHMTEARKIPEKIPRLKHTFDKDQMIYENDVLSHQAHILLDYHTELHNMIEATCDSFLKTNPENCDVTYVLKEWHQFFHDLSQFKHPIFKVSKDKTLPRKTVQCRKLARVLLRNEAVTNPQYRYRAHLKKSAVEKSSFKRFKLQRSATLAVFSTNIAKKVGQNPGNSDGFRLETQSSSSSLLSVEAGPSIVDKSRTVSSPPLYYHHPSPPGNLIPSLPITIDYPLKQRTLESFLSLKKLRKQLKVFISQLTQYIKKRFREIEKPVKKLCQDYLSIKSKLEYETRARNIFLDAIADLCKEDDDSKKKKARLAKKVPQRIKNQLFDNKLFYDSLLLIERRFTELPKPIVKRIRDVKPKATIGVGTLIHDADEDLYSFRNTGCQTHQMKYEVGITTCFDGENSLLMIHRKDRLEKYKHLTQGISHDDQELDMFESVGQQALEMLYSELNNATEEESHEVSEENESLNPETETQDNPSPKSQGRSPKNSIATEKLSIDLVTRQKTSNLIRKILYEKIGKTASPAAVNLVTKMMQDQITEERTPTRITKDFSFENTRVVAQTFTERRSICTQTSWNKKKFERSLSKWMVGKQEEQSLDANNDANRDATIHKDAIMNLTKKKSKKWNPKKKVRSRFMEIFKKKSSPSKRADSPVLPDQKMEHSKLQGMNLMDKSPERRSLSKPPNSEPNGTNEVFKPKPKSHHSRKRNRIDKERLERDRFEIDENMEEKPKLKHIKKDDDDVIKSNTPPKYLSQLSKYKSSDSLRPTNMDHHEAQPALERQISRVTFGLGDSFGSYYDNHDRKKSSKKSKRMTTGAFPQLRRF